jgi:hypothetical protein
MDLNGATLVHSGDDFVQIVADAEEGAVLALYGGNYDIPAGGDNEGLSTSLKIEKSITINGIFPTNKPVITGRFELYGSISVSMSNLVLDGQNNATTDQLFNLKDANAQMGTITVKNCEIKGLKVVEGETVSYKGYNKGLFYGNVACSIESVTFEDCYFHDIETDGGDFFDIRKSYAKKVTFQKSTIWNCAQKRDFIRYDDSSASFTDAAPVITVDQCTIDNVLNGDSGKRLLYVRFAGHTINWINNLVTNTKAVYTNQSKTNTPTYSNNYYFNCQNADLFSASDSELKVYWNGDTNGKNGEDPKYADAANGKFTIGNGTVSKQKVGDPRWLE